MWPFKRRKKVPLIYTDPVSKNARAVFETLDVGFTKRPRKADLLWIRRRFKPYFERLKPFQLFNHFPNERYLIEKGLLCDSLQTFDAAQTSLDLEADEFYQRTYCLNNGEDCERFLSEQLTNPDRENPWIMKPVNLSKGRGVRIVWEADQVRAMLDRPEEFGLRSTQKRFIAQRYIKNPLLLNDRKSEIRIYWLIASLDPLLVLMYREGTVRLNTIPFKMDDFENQLIHVTNVYQQKRHPGYDPNIELKWTFDHFESYVCEDLGLGDPNFLERRLKPQLKKYLEFTTYAAREALSSVPDQGHCFGVYGADLILDDKFQPWLTEVQKGPGLGYKDPVKARVIPPMLGEAAKIMLEIQKRKRAGESLETLESVRNFEWVIGRGSSSLLGDGR